MDNPSPILVKVPLITEAILFLELQILPNETAGQLSKRIGIYHPSSLCRWPLRVRLLPGENVYEIVKRGEALYIHSKEWDIGSAPAYYERRQAKE